MSEVTRYEPDISYGGPCSDCAIMVEQVGGSYVEYKELEKANKQIEELKEQLLKLVFKSEDEKK